MQIENKTQRLTRGLVLMGLCFGLVSFKGVKPRDPVALPVEQALRTRQFADLMPRSFSPDGKWLAYTVQENGAVQSWNLESYRRTGVPPWGSGTHIELVNVETGQTQNPTVASGNSWLPTWSPSGHYLAFLSDREAGETRLWIWDREKHEVRSVSSVGVRGDQIEWTPDDRALVVTTAPQDPRGGDSVEAGSVSTEGRKHGANTDGASSPLFYESGRHARGQSRSPVSRAWDLDIYRHDLTVVDRNDQRMTTLVHGERITAYSLAPDGSSIAYTVPKRFAKPGSQQILFDLRVVTLSGGQDRIVASDIPMEYDGRAFSWSPDSSQLSFRTGGASTKTSDCYVADLKRATLPNVTNVARSTGTGRPSRPLWDTKGHIYFLGNGGFWRAGAGQHEATEIGRVPDRRIVHLIAWQGNRLWLTGDGASTVVVAHDNSEKEDGFYRIDLETGKSEKLLEREQCYTCASLTYPFAVSQDGQHLAYVAEDAAHDEDLWVSSGNWDSARQLTHLNPQFGRYTLGTARLIRWLSDDGQQLQGALLLPSNYRKGKRYPLIVWVYGGSLLSNDLDHFGLAGAGPFNMQLFATRGYAVLLPDAPQHLGTPLADLAKAVLPGVNKAIDMGIADPQRLALAGHSYGGYSVLSLIIQTSRFKAAAEMDGLADLIGNYGEMNKDGSAFGAALDEGGQGLMGGTPWQERDRYIENSPIFYLDRITTPLLIVHGSDDTAVPAFLGDEIFVGLRRLGKEAQYVKYDRESHSPLEWSYRDQKDLCYRLIAWFDAHLGKKESQ